MQDLRVKGNSEEGGLRRASEGGWVVGEERSFRIEQMERCFFSRKRRRKNKNRSTCSSIVSCVWNKALRPRGGRGGRGADYGLRGTTRVARYPPNCLPPLPHCSSGPKGSLVLHVLSDPPALRDGELRVSRDTVVDRPRRPRTTRAIALEERERRQYLSTRSCKDESFPR